MTDWAGLGRRHLFTRKPIWVSKAVVLALHDEQLAEHGGASELRDEGLLDSALAGPQRLFHYGEPDMADLAACYAYGIIKNHRFVDGNKRGSLVSAELLLDLNGLSLSASNEEVVLTWLAAAAGETEEAALAAWTRPRLVSP